MPLSEDEQRILHEIERNFYEHDPKFAQEVGTTTLYRHAGRNIKWAAVAFIAGFLVLITQFSNLFLGFLGFLMMFASLVVIERNARKMSKAGLEQVKDSIRSRGMSDSLGDARRHLRERFKKDGD